MKKLLVLLVIGLSIFIYLDRYRLFLRNPLAHVTRDGVAVDEMRVMINYPNDILLQDSSDHRSRLYLVQHWNMKVGTPAVSLKCLQRLACLTDADEASETMVPAGVRQGRGAFTEVTMTNKLVEFVDEDGKLVSVTLR